MERQRIIIPTPDGELVTSLAPTLINDGDIAKFENAERVLGKTRKRPGTSELITEIENSVEPRGIYNFKKADGTEHILVYERGLTSVSPLTKKIYTAVAGTWDWDFINKDWATQGEDLVLTSPTVPRFETFRDYCFISQGDTVIGLMYWSGSGNIKRVIDEGDAEYGVSGRFINIWKERLVVSNGYYYALTGANGSAWSTSRISSGVFFSSLTYSDGTIVHPYQSKGWWEVVDTFKEIAPNDGSEIVAQWMGKNRMFFAKGTGIWAMFGDDPAHIVIDPITDIGMETDHSLREYMNGWIFKDKYGWRFFDGVNQPQLIDEPIRNLVMQVPNFDIGGNADMMQIEIDSESEWTAAQDGDATSNITIPNGNIELTESAISPSPYSYTSSDSSVTCGSTPIRIKYGFKFIPSPALILSTIKLKMKRGTGDVGTFDVSVFGDDEGQTGFPVVEMTTAVTTDIADLSQTETVETFDFSSQEVKLQNNRHYWVVISWEYGVSWFYIDYQSGDHSGFADSTFGEFIYGQWDYTSDKRGYIVADGTNYAATGDYETLNTGAGSLSFDQVPTVWGIFNVSDLYNQEDNIVYRMRTSTNQSDWTPTDFTGDDSIVTPGTEPLESNIPVKKYIDLKIDLTSFSSRLETPKVYSVRVNAAIDSGETTDRLMCSTIFNDKYLCATNNNKDGEFRTFVLDKEKKWGIYPEQLIRGYVDIDKEKYLMTLNDNMELYKMYPGKTVEEYFYDWSVYKNTSSKFYYFDIETKKTDCGYPGTLKLFQDLWITVGSIMGTKYVQGIIKYKIDDEDWVSQNFEDTADSGDISVVRLIFPAESRGYAIQFAYETYRDTSTIPPTDYGQPYNLQSAVLTFHTQPELKSTVETQTAGLDTGYLIEE